MSEAEIELLLKLDYITGCPQSVINELGIDISKFDTKEKITELINKYKEQKKMIELMLLDLSNDAFYMDDNEQYCEVKHKTCDGKENVTCKKCLLEYYRNKVGEVSG